MEGRRHSKVGSFSGLRTQWCAELAEAASSVVGGGSFDPNLVRQVLR
jgi:hypothetical protein